MSDLVERLRKAIVTRGYLYDCEENFVLTTDAVLQAADRIEALEKALTQTRADHSEIIQRIAWDAFTRALTNGSGQYGALDEALVALRREGFKIMAREPTEVMKEAVLITEIYGASDLYRAMWDAAP